MSECIVRLRQLIGAMPGGEHAAADALTLDLFARREELAKVKGDGQSGSDVVESVISRMEDGPKPLRTALARAHEALEPGHLAQAFRAARRTLSAAEAFDGFSPYVLATVGSKPAKKGKADQAAAKRDAVIEAIGARRVVYWLDRDEEGPRLDDRWLDVALRAEHLGMVNAVGRPGHAGTIAFLSKLLAADTKRGKADYETDDVLGAMAGLEHPGAADALMAVYEKHFLKPKATGNAYWYYRVIPLLPKSAIPALEAFASRLEGTAAEAWHEGIQKLRDRA